MWVPPPQAPKAAGVVTKITKKRKLAPKQLGGDAGDANQPKKAEAGSVVSNDDAEWRVEGGSAATGEAKANPLAALGSYGDSDSE